MTLVTAVVSPKSYEVRGQLCLTAEEGRPQVRNRIHRLSLHVLALAERSGRILADQTFHFPPDVDWKEGFSLPVEVSQQGQAANIWSVVIEVPRSAELSELIKQLSLEEARGLLSTLQQRGGVAHSLSVPLEHAFQFAPPSAPLQPTLPASWHAFGQQLGLSVTVFATEPTVAVPPHTHQQRQMPCREAGVAQRRQLRTDGFAVLHTPYAADDDGSTDALPLEELTRRLARGIESIEAKLHLPPLFIFAFDEAWRVQELLGARLATVLDDCSPTHDLRVRVVRHGADGYPMRREVGLHHGRRPSRVPDGSAGADAAAPSPQGLPKRALAWLPLKSASDARASSQFFLLPSSADPGFDDTDEAASASTRLPMLVADRHCRMRNVPLPVATPLVCSHRLIYWLTDSCIDSDGAMALGFAFAERSFEPPLLRWPCALPPLEARLALVALWVLIGDYQRHCTGVGSGGGGGAGGGSGCATVLSSRQLLLVLGLLQGNADHLSDEALAWSEPEPEPEPTSAAAGPAADTFSDELRADGTPAESVGGALQLALLACTQSQDGASPPASSLAASLAGTMADYITRQRGLPACTRIARLADARRALARSASPAHSPVRERPLSAAALSAALDDTDAPTLLRGGWDDERAASFRRQFEAYASGGATGEWQSLGAGRLRLSEAWGTPGTRIEHALDSLADGVPRSGPLDALLQGAAAGSAAADAAATRSLMREAAGRSRHAVQREPAFITSPCANASVAARSGRSDPHATAESVALTHFDEYTNLALLLVGTKRWMLLPPNALDWEAGPQSHSPNERLDVSLESHPELPWQTAEHLPGDVLVVPTNWWHRVVSERSGSVMLNVWCD